VRKPPRKIRPIALAVVRRGDDLLVYEGYDPVKDERFYRLLGGGVEFGETAAEAVHRELIEELGAELSNVQLLAVQENIFQFAGRPHHEIAFLFTADLVDRSFYERDELGTILDAGEDVSWQPLSRLFDPSTTEPTPDIRPLYPRGLMALLGGD
jgi:ADP-ribose pyrophosphatase YjhB (NUDIX family)